MNFNTIPEFCANCPPILGSLGYPTVEVEAAVTWAPWIWRYVKSHFFNEMLGV